MNKTLAVLVAVFAILLVACGGGAGGPGATTASIQPTVAAASPSPTKRPCCTKVTAAYSNISADDWLAWYAFEKGIFTDNGLTVDLQSINGGAQTSAAMLANSIQIGQFGGAEALSANAGGADLVLVANLAPVYPYKLYAAKGITSIAGLKGKKVGVSNAGGSSDIATRAALKSAGRKVGRPVHANASTIPDFKNQLRSGEGFAQGVAHGPRLPVIGDFDAEILQATGE